MTSKKKKPLAIDLFCGAGGMSLGFEQAGFHIAAAIDISTINRDTHSSNFPTSKFICANLSTLSSERIRAEAGLPANAVIDVVFGGPPCQGFSIGGKQEKGDKRNWLLMRFARLVVALKPRYFVMENVSGLMQDRFKDVLNKFRKILSDGGYRLVEPIKILDSSQFGVPQRRRRVFILGARKGNSLPSYPTPNDKRPPNVWQAIGDLSVVETAQLVNEDLYTGKLGRPSRYARDLRKVDSTRIAVRTNSISGFRRTVHSPDTVQRFSRIEQGQTDPVSRFIRLRSHGLSSTLRAGTGVERGSFMAPRPIHPVYPRCICLREAARLHSFPDWFVFHSAKWHGFMQIGNSVPPRLAYAVASEIALTLNRRRPRERKK